MSKYGSISTDEQSILRFIKQGDIYQIPLMTSEQLKVVSYNVLGPLHGESSKHAYAPVRISKWTRRRDKLIYELKQLNADILCLQEVSQKGLKETFIPGLKYLQLECCGFAPMRSMSNLQDMNRNKVIDHKYIGCSIFIRKSKIKLLDSKRIHLRKYANITHSKSDNLINDYRSKWNSMILIHALNIANNITFIVANTHIYWDPYRPDIKTLQTSACTNAIYQYITELNYTNNNFPPVILCGDFNTLPNLMDVDTKDLIPSAPFQLLEEGLLECNHPQHPDAYSNQLGSHNNPQLGKLESNILFQNIYKIPEYQLEQPLFTTKTDNFEGWIDHIWVTNNTIINYVLSLPMKLKDKDNINITKRFTPIPNQDYASDHLPIGMICSFTK